MGQSGTAKAERKVAVRTVTIAQSAAVSGVIDLREFALGGIIMPAAWTAADLGLKVCATSDGTFVPLKSYSNGYGTTVSIDAAAASAAYMFPVDAFVWPFVQLWSHNGSGTNTTQEALRTFTIVLKS